jgi:hypothetical protein
MMPSLSTTYHRKTRMIESFSLTETIDKELYYNRSTIYLEEVDLILD